LVACRATFTALGSVGSLSVAARSLGTVCIGGIAAVGFDGSADIDVSRRVGLDITAFAWSTAAFRPFSALTTIASAVAATAFTARRASFGAWTTFASALAARLASTGTISAAATFRAITLVFFGGRGRCG
jgi:hypothetical protein